MATAVEIIEEAKDIFKRHGLYLVKVPDCWLIYRKIDGSKKGVLAKRCKTPEQVLNFAKKQEPKDAAK